MWIMLLIMTVLLAVTIGGALIYERNMRGIRTPESSDNNSWAVIYYGDRLIKRLDSLATTKPKLAVFPMRSRFCYGSATAEHRAHCDGAPQTEAPVMLARCRTKIDALRYRQMLATYPCRLCDARAGYYDWVNFEDHGWYVWRPCPICGGKGTNHNLAEFDGGAWNGHGILEDDYLAIWEGEEAPRRMQRQKNRIAAIEEEYRRKLDASQTMHKR